MIARKRSTRAHQVTFPRSWLQASAAAKRPRYNVSSEVHTVARSLIPKLFYSSTLSLLCVLLSAGISLLAALTISRARAPSGVLPSRSVAPVQWCTVQQQYANDAIFTLITDSLLEYQREETTSMPRNLVHVTYEAAGVAAFGGLGAAVGKMLAGHGAGAIAVLPYFGFLRPQSKGGHAAAGAGGDAPQHLFSYDAACGLPGLPKTPGGGAPGAAGAFNAVPGRSLYHFWGVRGPGASWAVLVQPPSAVDYFAAVQAPAEMYPVPGPRGGLAALGVFAQGAAVAVAALCPPGGGLGGPCEGAVFHGGNTARALLAVRQLAADGAGQALAVSPELRSLYFIHDGLSEIKVFAAAEDLAGRLGVADALSGRHEGGLLGALAPVLRRSPALGPWRVKTPRLSPFGRTPLRRAPLPGLEALAAARALHAPSGSLLGLTALAALHADAVAPVSPSLAMALLPGGEVLNLGHTARALRAVHEAGRLWAVPPVAPAPAASLGLPSAGDVRADAASAARQLWAAKERARVRLLGEGYRGVLGAEGAVGGSRRFVVLFVGRLEANKGAALLVPLGRRVCGEGGHLVVLSTGATDDAGRRAWSALHSWKAERPECVSVVGGRDPQLGPLARAGADICVVPSWLEGFSMVAVEALQHGCYLVASDTVGLREHAQLANAGPPMTWSSAEAEENQSPVATAAGLAGEASADKTSPAGKTTAQLALWTKEDLRRPATGWGDLPAGCASRSAASFRLDAPSRLLADRDLAMHSPRTLQALLAAVRRGRRDLAACGERAAESAAFTLSRLPTPASVAARVRRAVAGEGAAARAPVRSGRRARLLQLRSLFAPEGAARSVGRLAFAPLNAREGGDGNQAGRGAAAKCRSGWAVAPAQAQDESMQPLARDLPANKGADAGGGLWVRAQATDHWDAVAATWCLEEHTAALQEVAAGDAASIGRKTTDEGSNELETSRGAAGGLSWPQGKGSVVGVRLLADGCACLESGNTASRVSATRRSLSLEASISVSAFDGDAMQSSSVRLSRGSSSSGGWQREGATPGYQRCSANITVLLDTSQPPPPVLDVSLRVATHSSSASRGSDCGVVFRDAELLAGLDHAPARGDQAVALGS